MKKLLIQIGSYVILIGIILFLFNINKRKDVVIQEKNINLASYTVQYKTDSGSWATQSSAIITELSDLRQVNRIADSLLSTYEKQLKTAYNVIKDQKKRLKDVQSVNVLLMEATGSDTVIYQITRVDTLYEIDIPPFDDGYLKFYTEFLDNNRLKRWYEYDDGIDISLTKERNPKDTRFFLWKWIKPNKQWYSTASTGNPNAEIKVNELTLIK